MDLQTFITVFIEGLKGYKDLFQDKTKAEEYSKLIADLTDKLSQIAKENDELRARLKEYEDWQKTASRYELFELAKDVFVYRLKPSEQKPSHYICPSCYEQKRKSILQYRRLTESGRLLVCHLCNFEVYDPSEKGPPTEPFKKVKVFKI